MYLATLFAVVSTVASGGEVSCDLVADEDTYRLIRDNDQAILILNPNSVDLISVPMWCGGSTCVNLEEEDGFDAGKLMIIGPTLKYDTEAQKVGEPTYSIWLNWASGVEGIEVSCTE
jgi:hypothetical protein